VRFIMQTGVRTPAEQARKSLISLHRWSKVLLMLAADCVALPACLLVAMLLRLDSYGHALQLGVTPYVAITILTVGAFLASGLYRAVIRFIDLPLLRSTGIGLAIVVLVAYFASFSLNQQPFPRSVIVVYWFTAFSYVVASRLFVRNFLRHNRRLYEFERRNVAIYGAGEAGARLAQALRSSNQYTAVCFFDDKAALANTNVAGLKVYHCSQIDRAMRHANVGTVILAMPSASSDRRREIVRRLRPYLVEIKTLQSLMELAEDRISAKSVREVRIEDLLGRAPVPPDAELLTQCIQSKRVLVTGAGGSIGSELCRQILACSPAELHLLDHSEHALYTIKQELMQRFPNAKLHQHLGSACDPGLVDHAVRSGAIQTIYHAAAYKHVPLVEANMVEGIRNNVAGAKVVAAAAARFRVQTCVLISTDKAVRPTNIMGASKRVAELIFQAAAAKPGGETTFSMVRFGNVLGSSGSVVPLFQQQIAQGGPVTVTHSDIVRYFMLIPEAAQLVIQAGAMALGGEVFVLDMGKPVKIVDLAKTMIEMSGLDERSASNPHGDIEIQIVGLRPGEKLYEELLLGKDVARSSHPRIMRMIEDFYPEQVLNGLIDDLLAACNSRIPEIVKANMRTLVPEYAPRSADGTHAATAWDTQTSELENLAPALGRNVALNL
jgi:FlaA1/EpsC-like NDP-sugar epimerase